MPEMGEYLVGAWLKLCKKCDIIVYGQKLRPTGRQMNEVDVIGIDLGNQRVYFCEVATHLGGLLYRGGNPGTAKKIEDKFRAAMRYAASNFQSSHVKYMLWAPYVSKGILTDLLSDLQLRLGEEGVEVELVINGEYASKVEELRERARTEIRDMGEPFYRALQIIEHLRS